jgi:hypothetical protein
MDGCHFGYKQKFLEKKWPFVKRITPLGQVLKKN